MQRIPQPDGFFAASGEWDSQVVVSLPDAWQSRSD
jgi:hypothetical protein